MGGEDEREGDIVSVLPGTELAADPGVICGGSTDLK